MRQKFEQSISSFTNSHSNQDLPEETKQKENAFQTIQEEIEKDCGSNNDAQNSQDSSSSGLLKQPKILKTLKNRISNYQSQSSDQKKSPPKEVKEPLKKLESPSPSSLKRIKVEKWVSKDLSTDSQKKNREDMTKNTLSMIHSTTKVKESVNKVLSKSVSKRPGIWSDYSHSMNSSRSKNPLERNVSMNDKIKRIIGRKNQDTSVNSLFLVDGYRLENDSKESNNSGFFDNKKTLRKILQNFVQHQHEKVNKEIEMNSPRSQSSLEKTIELVKNKSPAEGKDLSANTSRDKIIFNPSPSFSDKNKEKSTENLIETLNSKLAKTEEEKVIDPSENQEDSDMPDISSISGQRDKCVIETIPKRKTIEQQIKTIEGSYPSETPKEQLVNDDKAYNNNDSSKILVSNIPKRENSKEENSEEASTQSQCLNNYLSNEENKKNLSCNSLPSDVKSPISKSGIILFQNEADDDMPTSEVIDDGEQTPEGVDDSPMVSQAKNEPADEKDAFSDSKHDKSSGSDKGEIPVQSYSDDDKP